ncbi:MAG: hypothetical protein ACPG4N_00010 [Gammaproteobacteria bacterium]
MSATATDAKSLPIHLGVAEQGKLYALNGQAPLALSYFREALRLAQDAQEAEMFARHYSECAVETMETMGGFDEVIAYCDRLIDHYRAMTELNDFARKDLAHAHQRRAMALLKKGDSEAAREALETALQTFSELPLAKAVHRWLVTGLHITPERVSAEQKRQHYFSIRPETVNPAAAVRIPALEP